MIKTFIVCKERGIFAGTFGDDHEPVFSGDERISVQSVPVFVSRDKAKEICDELLDLDYEYGLIDVEVPETTDRIGYSTMKNYGLDSFATEMFINMVVQSETKH